MNYSFSKEVKRFIKSNCLILAICNLGILVKIKHNTKFLQKKKFLMKIKNAPKFLLRDIGRIERVRKFKYLGEIIQDNGLEKSSIEAVSYTHLMILFLHVAY